MPNTRIKKIDAKTMLPMDGKATVSTLGTLWDANRRWFSMGEEWNAYTLERERPATLEPMKF